MNSNQESKYKILLVEDEESLATGLEFNLSEENYSVQIARDGSEAVNLFEQGSFDLIILDVMLPYLNGFEVAEIIRKKSPKIPILILTAKSGIKDKISGLKLGADDYLTKPFHLEELLLRVSGMLRRKSWYQTAGTEKTIYSFGENEINFENLSCQTANGTITLTPNEAMVMKYLIENKGKIVSRKELLENVWQVNPEIQTRTIDNFIARLRKYFEPDPSNPIYIISIRGSGYMLKE